MGFSIPKHYVTRLVYAFLNGRNHLVDWPFEVTKLNPKENMAYSHGHPASRNQPSQSSKQEGILGVHIRSDSEPRAAYWSNHREVSCLLRGPYFLWGRGSVEGMFFLPHQFEINSTLPLPWVLSQNRVHQTYCWITIFSCKDCYFGTHIPLLSHTHTHTIWTSKDLYREGAVFNQIVGGHQSWADPCVRLKLIFSGLRDRSARSGSAIFPF